MPFTPGGHTDRATVSEQDLDKSFCQYESSPAGTCKLIKPKMHGRPVMSLHSKIRTTSLVLQPNDYMVRTDMKAGYHHMEVVILALPKVMVFTQLSFGLTPPP